MGLPSLHRSISVKGREGDRVGFVHSQVETVSTLRVRARGSVGQPVRMCLPCELREKILLVSATIVAVENCGKLIHRYELSNVMGDISILLKIRQKSLLLV